MERIKLLQTCLTFSIFYAVSSDVAETVFFIPLDKIVIKCPRTFPNSTIIWMHNNVIYWNGEKINSNIRAHKRLEVVGDHEHGEFNLKIVNSSLSDEGFYICLHNFPPKPFKYLLKVNQPISKHTDHADGSTIFSEVPTRTTITSTLISEENTQDLDHTSHVTDSGGWMTYSLLSVSVFSAILVGLLCLLFYKHRNSSDKHNDLHIVSESLEMNDTPHVYHLIDENKMEACIPEVHQHIEISAVGTQDSDPFEDERSQHEEPDYLHPYHSLVSVIDAEIHDYDETEAHGNALLLHETNIQRKKSIDTQVNQLAWNKTFSQGDITIMDLRGKAEGRNSSYDNELEQSEPNVEPVLVSDSITIITPNLNIVFDNISLD